MSNKSVLEALSDYLKYQRLKKRLSLAIATSVNDVERFKIGKTGQTVDDRYSKSTYKDEYKGIVPIYSSEDSDEISRLEADLNKEFKKHPKCDNDRTTDKDDMTDSEGDYTLYVVWK